MNPNPAFRLARKGSLQRKIIAWSFVPAVLIMLVVALVNFQAYIRVTEDLVLQRNRELARLKAAQLSTELLELRTLLDRQSSYLGRVGLKAFYSISNTARRQELLQVFNGGVVVLNDRGSILAAAPQEHYPEGSDWSETAIFNQVRMRSEPRPAISDILPVGPDGQPVIALAVPVMDPQGKYLGVLIGLMALEPGGGLYDSIGSLRLQTHGEAILVDGQGQVIYPSDPANPAADLSANPTVQQVMAGMVGSLRTRDASGNDVVASFAPVMGTRWGLVTQENWTSLLGSSQNYIWFLMGLLLLGVVLPTVVVTLGVRRITRPIAELALAAHEVAAGKFGRVVHAPTNDEVEELAIQFNSMAYQLQESYGRLEQRVEERTRQLATLNRISSVVSRTLDLADILDSALETSAEAMRMEAGVVYLLEDGWLALKADRGLSDEFLDRVEQLEAGQGASGEAARRGHPVVRTVGEYPPGNLRAAIQAEGLVLIVSVPLLSRGVTLGVMNLCTRKSRFLEQDEWEMLAAVGGQVGVAIENARLYRQAEQAAAAAERSRLARDLHDAVTQTLFSASLIAEVLPRLWARDPEQALARVEELRQLNRGALAEMRSLLLELRPAALYEASLNELFRHLADAFTGRTRLPVNFQLQGDANLPGEVRVAFYRIAQEALNNIARHAAASRVDLELICLEDQIRLVVRDDGRGFDPGTIPADHLGVRIMGERAVAAGAKLTVRSRPGQGTEITAVWSEVRAPGSQDTAQTDLG